MSAPDLTQKVLGFREWRIIDGQLVSQGRGDLFWVPGRNEARCIPQQEYFSHLQAQYALMSGKSTERPKPKKPCVEPPGQECACGLYALHKTRQAWWTPGTFDEDSDWTCGAILGWGRMQIHRSGYRAEFASPALLAYDELRGRRHVERVKQVASDYGCHAVRIEQFEDAAAALGDPTPTSLYPPREKKPAPRAKGPLERETALLDRRLAAMQKQAYTKKRRWGLGL